MDGGGEFQKRRVAALDLPGVIPGPVADWLPRFQTVSPSALLVDETYQRGLSAKSRALIARIVAGWDWARFKPPIVAETPQGFEVIDGQHTAIAAASHPAIHEIPVMIVEAREAADKAGAFLGHNRDRLAMMPVDMHRAALEAQDPAALSLERVAGAAGVSLPRCTPSSVNFRANQCLAFSTLYALLAKRGEAGLVRIFAVLTPAKFRPLQRFQIAAADALLFGREYQGADEAAIAEAFAEVGDDLERQAQVLAAQHRLKLAPAVAVVIFRRSQRGRRKIA